MSIEDAPVKEIMKDMMEMSRGVQHPIRYWPPPRSRISMTFTDSYSSAASSFATTSPVNPVTLSPPVNQKAPKATSKIVSPSSSPISSK